MLTHPAVEDCAVIQVPDHQAGEVPKAYVVRSPSADGVRNERLTVELYEYVKQNKAHYKWLSGGVEFIKVVPKSPSGKILRRILRDQEKSKARQTSAKI